MDGFAGFAMHRSQAGGPNTAKCPCGASMPSGDRLHHFWDCTVAQSLRGKMGALLNCHLTRNHLWLVNPPVGVAGIVWDVVCLSAIAALERGRQYLYKHRDEGDVQNLVDRAGITAESTLWERLDSFASVAGNKRGWESVGRNHPFLCVDAEGRIRSNTNY